AEFGELRPEFDGEVRRFVPLGNMRLQLGFSKFTDGTFDLLLFFVQLEIHLPSGMLTWRADLHLARFSMALAISRKRVACARAPASEPPAPHPTEISYGRPF